MKKVFQFKTDELPYFEKNSRLGSPSHWRQYFAYSLPTYALADDEISEFRKAAGHGGNAPCAKLLDLLQRQHTRPGHYVDVLLDRLNDLPDDALTDNEMRGIAEALCNGMDEVLIKTQEIKLAGQSEVWLKATKLIKRSNPKYFQKLVKQGKAIGWLSELVRDQGFAHGRPDGNRASTDRQWLNTSQTEKAATVLISRFKKAKPADLFSNPSPLDMFYLWQQLGNERDLRRHFLNWTKGDDEFLQALDAVRGWSSSSNVGVRHPIRKMTVAAFMDADKAKERLEKIETDETAAKEMKFRAHSLLGEWEDDTNRNI